MTKERANCRKQIENTLRAGKFTLEDIIEGRTQANGASIRKQAKLMRSEAKKQET